MEEMGQRAGIFNGLVRALGTQWKHLCMSAIISWRCEIWQELLQDERHPQSELSFGGAKWEVADGYLDASL